MNRLYLLGALLSIAAAPAVLAQPNPDATPAAGTVALAAGFSPDPRPVDVMAGGPAEAAATDAGCSGYVSAAPSVVFDYSGDVALPLRLFVRSSSDTVLLVHTPGGDWLCNDDDEGLNAGLAVDAPAHGRYAVWVGTFSDAGATDAPATLYASQAAEVGFNVAGTPSAGTVSLATGFSPDPHQMAVTAGGPNSAYVEDGCAGFVDASAPTAVLDWGGDGTSPLYVYARPEGDDDDLTLAVIGPDDAVHCNDDADGLNPGLVVEPAAAGRYAVWVGSYSSRARTEPAINATLFFSGTEGPTGEDFAGEDYYDDGTYEGGEDISRFATPAHGTLSLDAGFGSRDVAVQAGGADEVSVSGAGCAGYIANGEPDVNVLYGGEGSLLAFYAESEADATLLVNLPDGSWRCSDDEIGRNPVIAVEEPQGGLYNVWVGTFSQGTGSPATLHVTESDPR